MANLPEKQDGIMMLLGEIKATLLSNTERLKQVEDRMLKRVDRLEERVTELESKNQRMQGYLAAGLFVGTFIVPLIFKKLGLQ
jgi:hypothetical protein